MLDGDLNVTPSIELDVTFGVHGSEGPFIVESSLANPALSVGLSANGSLSGMAELGSLINLTATGSASIAVQAGMAFTNTVGPGNELLYLFTDDETEAYSVQPYISSATKRGQVIELGGDMTLTAELVIANPAEQIEIMSYIGASDPFEWGVNATHDLRNGTSEISIVEDQRITDIRDLISGNEQAVIGRFLDNVDRYNPIPQPVRTLLTTPLPFAGSNGSILKLLLGEGADGLDVFVNPDQYRDQSANSLHNTDDKLTFQFDAANNIVEILTGAENVDLVSMSFTDELDFGTLEVPVLPPTLLASWFGVLNLTANIDLVATPILNIDVRVGFDTTGFFLEANDQLLTLTGAAGAQLDITGRLTTLPVAEVSATGTIVLDVSAGIESPQNNDKVRINEFAGATKPLGLDVYLNLNVSGHVGDNSYGVTEDIGDSNYQIPLYQADSTAEDVERKLEDFRRKVDSAKEKAKDAICVAAASTGNLVIGVAGCYVKFGPDIEREFENLRESLEDGANAIGDAGQRAWNTTRDWAARGQTELENLGSFLETNVFGPVRDLGGDVGRLVSSVVGAAQNAFGFGTSYETVSVPNRTTYSASVSGTTLYISWDSNLANSYLGGNSFADLNIGFSDGDLFVDGPDFTRNEVVARKEWRCPTDRNPNRMCSENETANIDHLNFLHFDATNIDRIVVNGSEFDDSIYVHSSVTIDTEINGYQGDDKLIGGRGNDTINGGSGADELIGNFGDDTLNGGADDDLLVGDYGNDTLRGGSGNDRLDEQTALDFGVNGFIFIPPHRLDEVNYLYGEGDDDELFGSPGIDTLEGGSGIDHLFGGLGDDTLRGDQGNDFLQGGEGNDLLEGGSDDDYLVGESGIDRLWGGSGDDTLLGDNENDDLVDDGNQGDYLYGEGGYDLLYGGVGGDWLEGGFQADMLKGGPGNDTLFGLTESLSNTHYTLNGNDRLFGDEDNDTLHAGTGGPQSPNWPDATDPFLMPILDGGSGNDNLIGSDGPELLSGGDGDDTIQGMDGDDILRAGQGAGSLEGGDGDDTIYGSDLVDENDNFVIGATIDGGAGDDIIVGGLAIDHIQGGPGNDRIAGVLSNDVIDGGDGDDLIYGDDGLDTIQGSGGNDEIHGGIDRDTIRGGDGEDHIFGDDGDDEIFGDAENDSLSGGSGNDQIFGGAGDDTIDGELGDDTIEGNDGVDTIDGGLDHDNIQGGDGNDIISGGFGDDNIQGGLGDDTIHGNQGIDTIDGDAGNDTIDGNEGNDQIFGGIGDDNLSGSQGIDQIQGEDGLDSIYGGTENDVIQGGPGDDSIYGGEGDDEITGGPGADTILGGDGVDNIQGNDGDDTISGNEGPDTISGGEGADVVVGNEGDDQLFGNAGNDLIRGLEGIDIIEGNSGADEIHGGQGDDRIFGHSTSGSDDDGSNDLIFGDEGEDYLLGQDGDDEIHGGDQVDLILGGIGNDTIHGDQAPDRLLGEQGNDTIVGGTGEDEIFGGPGDDTISGSEDSDAIRGGDGNDTVDGGPAADAIYGGIGDDNLFGNGGNDRIFAGPGQDNVSGGTDQDHIFGEEGDDTLQGDEGNDYVDGGLANDTLLGGMGNDQIVGGPGLNILYGNEGDDRLIGSDDGANTDPDFTDNLWFGDQIFGGTGRDTILALGGADFVDGGDEDDRIETGIGSDYAIGGAGDDWIYAGIGLGDEIQGGIGDDELIGSHQGDDIIMGGPGQDQLFGQGGNDVLSGEIGDDFIDAGTGTDIVSGGLGNDELIGGGGVGDQLSGNEGDDVIRGSDDGADIVSGGPGADAIFGNGGNDQLSGDEGDDIIRGGAGDDLIQGNLGRDLLIGEADHDRIYGHSVSESDDQAVDYLYGDFGTNRNEPGSGQDQLFGGGGSDQHFGEGEDDLIVPGPGTSDLIDYGSGEGSNPDDFVPPTMTPAPPIAAGTTLLNTSSRLPQSPRYLGRWTDQIASSLQSPTSHLGLLGAESTIAVDPSGTIYMAWVDRRHGNAEIYVSRRVAGNDWEQFGASSEQGGISQSESESRSPAIALDASGNPIVVWMERLNNTSNIVAKSWNSVTDEWELVGNSFDLGGLSQTGTAASPSIVSTGSGPVVAWLDTSGTNSNVFSRRWNGTNWEQLDGSGQDGGASDSNFDVQTYALATDGSRIAITWSASDSLNDQIYARGI